MLISSTCTKNPVQQRNVMGLLIAGLVFAGLTYALPAQNAFAHNFSHNETTSFLASVEMTKTYLDLVKSNAEKDPGIAKIYAERAATSLDEKWIKEIAEKNKRVATDLPQSLNQLPLSISEGRSIAEIKSNIANIKGLVGEAVSVRIDKAQLTNSTTQSLVAAKVLSEALLQYSVAQGVPEDQAYALAYGIMKMSSMGTNMTTATNSTKGSMGMGKGAMNMTSYEAAKALAGKALYIGLTKIKKSDATNPALVDEAKMALRTVKSGIDGKQPWMQVMTTMHKGVHENLRLAFNLQLQG
jgi:hypothetical protein